MKKLRYILILSILLSFSCSEKILDEIDTDPNNPTSVPVSYIIPTAQIKMVNSLFGGATATAISTYVEQTCNVHPEKMDIIRKTGLWDVGYQILKDSKQIIDKGTEENLWVHVGIGQVIEAFTLGTLAEVFGDIPWTEALLGSENRNPHYDTQESIYNAIFKALDDAITNFSKTSVSNPGNFDLLLKGDANKWSMVAWGLKARYRNRLSNLDPSGSATKALEGVANSFKSADQSLIFAKYKDATTYSNPISYEENQMSRFSASITILNVINSFNAPGYVDPRAERWFDKINGNFVGAPNGENVADLGKTNYSGVSKTNVLKLSAPMPLLTYDEMKFIESEANFRLGKLVEANAAYKAAVIAACTRAGLTTDQITTYTSQGTVFTDDANLTLEMIIKQKYLSFFMFQPIEAYNDYRRTLIPSPLYNKTDGFPFRIIYPESETARNVNTPKDIDLVTIYTTKLWWAK